MPLDIIIGTELLAVVLSAGGATMLAALIQAYRSIKEGARADEHDAFADMEQARKDAVKHRRIAELERDHWHSRAGTLEWIILTKLGPDQVPPPLPIPQVKEEDSP